MKPYISNKGEKEFYSLMRSKGILLERQPQYPKKFQRQNWPQRADFYSPITETYYEVISNYSAYYERYRLMLFAIFRGMKLNIVNPDGTVYRAPQNRKPVRIFIRKFLKSQLEFGKESYRIKKKIGYIEFHKKYGFSNDVG